MLWTDCTCLCHLGAPHEAPPPHTGPPSAELKSTSETPKRQKAGMWCQVWCQMWCQISPKHKQARRFTTSDLRKVVEPDSRLELLAYALRVPFVQGVLIFKRIMYQFIRDYLPLYGIRGTCHNSIVVPMWCQLWCQVVKWGKHERPTEIHTGFCARNHKQGKGQKWPH